jgi:hypothetical protein
MSGKVENSGIQVVSGPVKKETSGTMSENEKRVTRTVQSKIPQEPFNGYVPDHDDYSICQELGIRMSDLTGGTPDAKTSPSPSKNSDSPLDSDPDYDALEDSLRREDWLLEQGLVNSQTQDSCAMQQPDEEQEDLAPAAEPTPTPEMLPGHMVEVETSYRSSSPPRELPVPKQLVDPVKRVKSLSPMAKNEKSKDEAPLQTVKKPIESPLLTTDSVRVYRNFVVTKYKEPWARMCMDENYMQQKPVQNKFKHNPKALPQDRLKEDWKLVQEELKHNPGLEAFMPKKWNPPTVSNVSLGINSTPVDPADQHRIQQEIIGSGFENEQIYTEVCQLEQEPTPINLTDSFEFSDRS